MLDLKDYWTLMSVLYDDVFRRINKQPGMQKFWNWCNDYQEIYGWTSSFNKQSGLSFILTQQSMGGNEYGKSGHLSMFTSLKHLMMLLKCKFFRASFVHLIKGTDCMSGHAAQIFFKVETLLNNAFNMHSWEIFLFLQSGKCNIPTFASFVRR